MRARDDYRHISYIMTMESRSLFRRTTEDAVIEMNGRFTVAVRRCSTNFAHRRNRAIRQGPVQAFHNRRG